MQRSRRVFIRVHEVPGLLLGALRGDGTRLRRILGARRSVRIGLVLAGSSLLAAAPSAGALAPLVGLHLLLALCTGIPRRGSIPLSWLRWLKLSLWTVAPLLAAAAGLRLLWPPSLLPACVAILAGHLLVWHGLRGELR